MGIKYTYECEKCEEVEETDQEIDYKCDCGESYTLKSEESFMWECSECGNYVHRMNDVCSQSCFNAMMR